MNNFNFSKPETQKSSQKKVAWYEKIWAGISLIALFGEGVMPKGAKDNIPVKVRNIIIIIFILIIAYLIGCGIYLNVKGIIHAVHSITFSFGESFYYFGIVVMVFTALSYFNIDKWLLDFADQKKIVTSVMNNISTETTGQVLKDTLKSFESFNLLHSIMGAITFFWTIWGMIFYDRILFITLFGLSPLFSLILMPMKDLKKVRVVFIADIIVTLIVLSAILINHFTL